MCLGSAGVVNSVDPGQEPHSLDSDLGICCSLWPVCLNSVKSCVVVKQCINPFEFITEDYIFFEQHKYFQMIPNSILPRIFFFLLCWGLTTHQPLWVILCRLPEKGRK